MASKIRSSVLPSEHRLSPPRILLAFLFSSSSIACNAGGADAPCEHKMLYLSALNRAAQISELVTLDSLVNSHSTNNLQKYVQKLLRNEIEVAKTILMQLEARQLTGHLIGGGFDDSKSGTLIQDLRARNVDLGSDPSNFIPSDLQEAYGNEGIALFSALYSGMIIGQ